MLLKDKEVIKVPEKFLKNFIRPMIFRLTPENMPIDHISNKRKVPRTFAPEATFSYFDENERRMVEMRFAETKANRQVRGGVPLEVFNPERIHFRNGQIVCDPDKITHKELAYWLSIHPRNRNSVYFDATKPAWFELEDKSAEAKERNSKRASKAKAENLIYEVWGPNELSEICRSFDVRNVDDLSLDERQDILAGIMDKDPQDFLKRAEDEEMLLRAHISHAKELGILIYDWKNWTWKWGAPSGKEAEIVKVRPGEDEKKRLIQHWNRVPKAENIDYFYEQLNFAKEKQKADRDESISRRKEGKKVKEPAQ